MIYFILALFFIAILIADQLSKYLVVKYIALGGMKPLIPGIVHLTHLRNDGMSFSMLSGARWFFVVVTLLVFAAAVWAVKKKYITHPMGLCSLTAVMGGAIGNLIDRVRLGYVVDMIEVEFIRFAVFNVADMFVVCGGILLMIYGVFFWKDPSQPPKQKEGTDDPPQ